MRELALKCLVKALKCLVAWYEDMEIGKEVSIQYATEEQQPLQLSTEGNTADVNQIVQVIFTSGTLNILIIFPFIVTRYRKIKPSGFTP